MKRSPGMRRHFRFPWRSDEEIRREVDEEVRFHLDMREAELIRSGMEPEAARKEAERQFGDVSSAKERLSTMDRQSERRSRILTLFEELGQDLRYAWRTLTTTPGFAAVSILVLGLGIGANTAIFTLVNSLLLRPLAIEKPHELVGISSRSVERPDDYRSFSYPNYLDLRERNTIFTELMAHTISLVGMREGEGTRRIMAGIVSANYFETFGVHLEQGRGFLAEEERPGSGVAAVVVSHRHWQRSGEPGDVLGSELEINGRTFTVVGVAPPGFTGTTAIFSPDVWLPLGMYEAVYDLGNEVGRPLDDRNNHTLMLVGRLRPELTAAAAEPELSRLSGQMSSAQPEVNGDQELVLYELPRLAVSDQPISMAPMNAAVAVLIGMAAVVLLIACLNLANMLIARGATRRTEFALRLALGGGRARLLRQLLTEGFLLALLGGVAGLFLTFWVGRIITNSLASLVPMGVVVLHTEPDLRVLAATLSFCTLATLFFALGPAWGLTRAELNRDLKEQGGDDLTRHGRPGLLAPRNLLVIGQIALSLVLLASGGLFVRAALAAADADPGFPLDDGVIVEVDPSLIGYDEAQTRRTYDDVLERLRSLPEVESASMASLVPYGMVTASQSVRRPGATADDERASAFDYVIGADYFATLRVPVLRGREFRPADLGPEGSPIVILNQPLAKLLFGDEEAVGRQVEVAFDGNGAQHEQLEVVGVVPGLRHDFFEASPKPHLYTPFGRHSTPNMHVYVRPGRAGRAREAELLEIVRQEIRGVDERLPVLGLETLRGHRDKALTLWMIRAGAKIFTTFGILALILAVIGVYGVKAYVVSRRTREIGIRMALGASARDVRWLVLREGLVLTGVGLAIGLALALLVGQGLASMLYRVSATDPLTFGTASLLLAAASLLAAYLPARRASRVAPTTALRYE